MTDRTPDIIARIVSAIRRTPDESLRMSTYALARDLKVREFELIRAIKFARTHKRLIASLERPDAEGRVIFCLPARNMSDALTRAIRREP